MKNLIKTLAIGATLTTCINIFASSGTVTTWRVERNDPLVKRLISGGDDGGAVTLAAATATATLPSNFIVLGLSASSTVRLCAEETEYDDSSFNSLVKGLTECFLLTPVKLMNDAIGLTNQAITTASENMAPAVEVTTEVPVEISSGGIQGTSNATEASTNISFEDLEKEVSKESVHELNSVVAGEEAGNLARILIDNYNLSLNGDYSDQEAALRILQSI